ncbi:MAG: hypothetical protein V4850_29470 [Myxococcota bacterium]
MRDIAFPDTDVSLEWSELDASFAFANSTTAVPDSQREADARYASAVAGAAGIFVLEHLVTEDAVATEAIAPHLLLLDPDTFVIVDTLALAPHGPVRIGGNPSLSAHGLVGSTTAPILYQVAGDDPGLAWRVETNPLRLEPLSWPTMEEGFSPVGFEKDGVALVRSGGAALRIDLAAGTVQQAGNDALTPFDPTRTEAFSADATGAVAAYGSPAGLSLVQLDWSGEGVLIADLPVPTAYVDSLFRLSDGTIVITAAVAGTSQVNGGESLAISLRYDPVVGTWASPEGDCDGLAGEGWVTGHGAPLRVEAVEGAERSFALEVVTLHPVESAHAPAPADRLPHGHGGRRLRVRPRVVPHLRRPRRLRLHRQPVHRDRLLCPRRRPDRGHPDRLRQGDRVHVARGGHVRV